jgi:enamine deaminase RidA (YjgF/YER057c/UK114 family)
MAHDSPDARFLSLGAEIPPPIQVPGTFSFVLVRVEANTAYLAGHGPNRLKQPPEFDYVGKVGSDLTTADAYAAARLCGLNLLVSLRDAVGTLDRVTQVLQLFGAVNSAPGFVDQSTVLNGCSDLLVQIFGGAGKPARMSVGVNELPFGMAVEASMIVGLRA